MEKKNPEVKQIILKRKNEINNGLRNINVVIDKSTAVKLLNKEKIVSCIGSKPIKLYAKIDWCQSPEIEINFKKEELKKTIIISSQISNTYIIIISISLIFGLILTFIWRSWYYLIPFFLLYLRPLYYITFGRKKYLKVDEVSS